MSNNMVTLSAAASYATSIRLVAVMADTVTLSYDTLPGNQPATYQNFVGVWDSENVGYDQPPIARQNIATNTQSGTVFIDNLNPANVPYIFGYAVGPDVDAVCATTFIAPGQPPVNFSSSLMLLQVTADRITVHYDFPSGFVPGVVGSSVVVWKGPVPLYNQPPMAKTPLATSSGSGTAAVNVNVLFGASYTVGLLMTLSPTSLAASITFST